MKYHLIFAILIGIVLTAATSADEYLDDEIESGVINSRSFEEEQVLEREEKAIEIISDKNSKCPTCKTGTVCCMITYWVGAPKYSCCKEKASKDFEFTFGDFKHGRKMIHQHMRINSKDNTVIIYNDDRSIAVQDYTSKIAAWYIPNLKGCLLIANASTAESADAFIKELQTATSEKTLSVSNFYYKIKSGSSPIEDRLILPSELEDKCIDKDLYWLEQYTPAPREDKAPSEKTKPAPKDDKASSEKTKEHKKPVKADDEAKESRYMWERSEEGAEEEAAEEKRECKMGCAIYNTSKTKYRKSCMLWTCQ